MTTVHRSWPFYENLLNEEGSPVLLPIEQEELLKKSVEAFKVIRECCVGVPNFRHIAEKNVSQVLDHGLRRKQSVQLIASEIVNVLLVRTQ